MYVLAKPIRTVAGGSREGPLWPGTTVGSRADPRIRPARVRPRNNVDRGRRRGAACVRLPFVREHFTAGASSSGYYTLVLDGRSPGSSKGGIQRPEATLSLAAALEPAGVASRWLELGGDVVLLGSSSAAACAATCRLARGVRGLRRTVELRRAGRSRAAPFMRLVYTSQPRLRGSSAALTATWGRRSIATRCNNGRGNQRVPIQAACSAAARGCPAAVFLVLLGPASWLVGRFRLGSSPRSPNIPLRRQRRGGDSCQKAARARRRGAVHITAANRARPMRRGGRSDPYYRRPRFARCMWGSTAGDLPRHALVLVPIVVLSAGRCHRRRGEPATVSTRSWPIVGLPSYLFVWVSSPLPYVRHGSSSIAQPLGCRLRRDSLRLATVPGPAPGHEHAINID